MLVRPVVVARCCVRRSTRGRCRALTQVRGQLCFEERNGSVEALQLSARRRRISCISRLVEPTRDGRELAQRRLGSRPLLRRKFPRARHEGIGDPRRTLGPRVHLGKSPGFEDTCDLIARRGERDRHVVGA